MQVGAGYIVCLNILADVVTEVAKDIGGCSNGVYTLNQMLRVLDTSSNMWSQAWIPRLDCEDDGNV
jgi:hypothetical protein